MQKPAAAPRGTPRGSAGYRRQAALPREGKLSSTDQVVKLPWSQSREIVYANADESKKTVHVLTTDEIIELVDKFSEAAWRLQQAGLDADGQQRQVGEHPDQRGNLVHGSPACAGADRGRCDIPGSRLGGGRHRALRDRAVHGRRRTTTERAFGA